MPRLPVSTPTMSFATPSAAPMKPARSAPGWGRLAKESIDPTVAGRFLLQERGRSEELRFGSKGDQQVALLESQVGAWAHVQGPVVAPQREQLRCGRVEQSGFFDGLADRGHSRSDQ